MELLIKACAVVAAVMGIVAGVLKTSDHRDAALWFIFGVAFFVLLGFFLWVQDHLWRRDAEAAPSQPAALAKVHIVETKLIIPDEISQPLRISFGLINMGSGDATFRIWDRTYYFSTDPTQKVFKYQSAPSHEISIEAIPNAVWRGEIRFDFQMTPEKIAALKSGSARLFLMAKAEYHREDDSSIPLRFEHMYDADFPGNLVVPPDDVAFE